MAYTVLDSKASVLNTRGPVSSSLSSADARSYRSGLVSPNGELMIIPTRYRNNDSSLNHGVDVRKSGSNGAWDLISSVPQRTTSGLCDLVWVNNKEFIFTTNDAYEELVVVTASAGGVDFGLHKVITRNDNTSGATNWKLEISADKDALLAYHEPGQGGDQYVWVFNSGSADAADAGWNWTQTVRVTNQSSKDVYSARWLRTNDEFAVGDSNNNKVWIVQRTGSSLDGWPSYVPSAGAASAYSITGSQASSYFGMTMEWHTGSNSLIIWNNAQAEVHASSSQGYSGKNQPAYTLTGSAFDNASGGLTGYSSKIYKNSIFYRLDATYHDTLTIDSVYVLESGSNTGGYPGGWRAEFLTQSGQAEIYNVNPEDRAPGQIFVGGGILSLEPGRNASGAQTATNFHVFTTGLGTEGASSPTSLDGEVTGSIVAADGGLVQAGNTDSNPSAQANIPAGALGSNTDITVAILSQSAGKGDAVTSILELPTQIVAPRASSDIIRFTPHGTSFSSPAILSWNITGSTAEIRIFRRANASSAWAELATSYYSFNGGQVHVTASSFSDYMAVGGASMAVTKIGTKLIKDGVVTTVKLGSSAVTRGDIASGSVQVTHLDLSSQARADHVDCVSDDRFICNDVTDNEVKTFTFTQLKTALSLSNAARGNEGAIQYNGGSGFDGIAKINSDGVHLTASNAGKFVFAYTGISGSTGEIYADSKTGVTIKASKTLILHSSGSTVGRQSGSLTLNSAAIIPEPLPAVAVTPGVYKFIFTSGSTVAVGHTYGPAANYKAQCLEVKSSGSEAYLFYLSNGSSTSKPTANNLNIFPTNTVREIAVEAVSAITDWRTVVTNFYNAMNTELNTRADLATVAVSGAGQISHTASITVTYKAGTIAGAVAVGSGKEQKDGSPTTTTRLATTSATQAAGNQSNAENPIANNAGNAKNQAGEQSNTGVYIETTTSGSDAIAVDSLWLNLGGASNKYSTAYVSVLSASSAEGDSAMHKLTVDEVTVGKVQSFSSGHGGVGMLSGSGTASLHKLDVDEGTFNKVVMTTTRAAAAYMITGSGTAQIHKLDADEGDFRRVITGVVSGSGTSTLHKVDVDEGTFNKAAVTVVTSSGTSLFHKIDGDEGDFRKVVSTNITSSGTSNLHVLTGDEISGSSGKFRKLVVDDLSARKITSGVSTSEHFEVPQKQYIPFASGSAGASAEGAGLQIGGTAGTGSAGVASVVLGDAGSGAGKDLLLKIGSTQGASLSGSVSDAGQRFGVTGSISGSIGIFHNITINTAMGNQTAQLSGSTFNAQTVTGTLAQIFDLDVNQGSINDVDGTSATFTTVSGTTVQAHTLDTDKLTGNDVDGVSMTISGVVSGSTVDGHLLDTDKIEVRTITATSTISGSTTATLHKVTSDVLSGSKVTTHNIYADKLNINEISTADSIKKSHLNADIVRNASNAHGGIVFNNGQLSVGWQRRIFSRSSKKIVNRTQPTQGSGSLYTTCSINDVRMVSGSENVYFNGLLLVKSNGVSGNPRDADYRIQYNSGGDVIPGVYKLNFTSGSTRSSVTAKGSGGSDPQLSTYAPITNGVPQVIFVQSTGSSNTEQYVFYLDDGGSSPLPVSASINMDFSDFGRGKRRHDIPVEAVASINDWRDVVTNLKNKMIGELQHSASLATISYTAAATVNHTASITITYDAGTIPGQVGIGTGVFRVGSGYGKSATTNHTSEPYPVSNTPAPIEAGLTGTNHDYKNAGTPDHSGGTLEITTSGSDPNPGFEIFLHESLTMDSDDVVVVQYLSGSHVF